VTVLFPVKLAAGMELTNSFYDTAHRDIWRDCGKFPEHGAGLADKSSDTQYKQTKRCSFQLAMKLDYRILISPKYATKYD